MIEQEFKVQMDRLKKEWPNAYGDSKIKLFWNYFKKTRTYIFTEVVTHLLGNRIAPPMLDIIAGQIKTLEGRSAALNTPERPKDTSNLPWCHLCGCVGLVWAHRKPDKLYRFVFKCSCPHGEAKQSKFDTWGPRFEKDFDLDLKHGTVDLRRVPNKEDQKRYYREIRARLNKGNMALPYDPKKQISQQD